MSKSTMQRRGTALFVLWLLLFSFLSVPLSVFVQSAGGESWNPDWRYRKSVTIDHSLVAADLVSFPVLIDIDDADLASKAQPDGDDIYFTDSGGVQLSHEVELYSAGHLVAWVKVPSVSSSADTLLYMYYGNDEAENQEDASGVWDANFMMVQHLSEGSGTHFDSTSNNNDGSAQGVVQGTTGKIDGADDFDGTNDYVTIPHSSTVTGFTQAFTASVWIKMDSVSGRRTLLNKWNTNSQRAWMIDYDSSRGTNSLGLFVSADGSAYSYWYAAFSPVAGNWYHITVVWRSGQQPLFYVNGALVIATTATVRASIFSNTQEPLYIGRSYLTSGRFFDGVIDEVCLSNLARSIEWISTSYSNQMDPSSFYAVGLEESSGNPVVSNPFPLNGTINVPISLSELSFYLADPDGDLMNYSVTTNPWIGYDFGLNVENNTYLVGVLGLSYNTAYTWYVDVTDGVLSTSVTYTFTTVSEPLPPVVLAPYPADGATDVSVSLEDLSCYVSDPNGDVMNMTCTTDPDIGFTEGLNIPDTWFTTPVETALSYDTTYIWHVNVTDGVFWTNVTYNFTTVSEPPLNEPPVVSSPNPANGATDVPVSLSQLGFSIADPDEDLMDYYVSTDLSIGGGSEVEQADGTYSVSVSGLSYSTTYTWYVNVTDGTNWTNMTYHFTTEEQPEGAPWYNNDWLYRKQITILSSQVTGNLVDFPVLVEVTDADLAVKARSDGFDILFTDSSGVSKLDHEIESYESGSGHLVAWVQVPSLSASEDTVLFMYYGNSLAADQQNSAAVWDSSFMMVQHLSETSGIHYDSTINGNDGTPNGPVQGTDGKIDGADDFDGTNDYVTISDSGTLAGFTGGFTASFWIRMDSITGRQTMLNKWNTGTGQRAWYVEFDSSQTNKLTLFVSQDGSSYSYWRALFNPVAGTWYHIDVVWRSGQQPLFYVNGAAVTATTSTLRASVYNNAEPLYIGRSYTTGRYFNGVIDEVRLSDSARSVQWIQTCYSNQMNPSAFINVGAEEEAETEPTPPAVVSHVPGVDETGVSVATIIVVNFSEPMNQASTEAAFSVTGSVVTGTFTWPSSSALIFTPDAQLGYLTLYTVTITTDAQDMQGEDLTEPCIWSFTTEVFVPSPPYVVPPPVPDVDATGVLVTTAIQVTFSEAMDLVSTEAAFSISPSVSGTFSWSSGDTVMTFTPTSNLAYGTLYTVTISASAKDAQEENMLAPYSWSFTTETEPEPTPPTVVSHVPGVDATSVSITTTIQVTFSEAMNRASTEAAFSISPLVSGTFAWNTGNTTMTFTPSSQLSLNTTYTVTISTGAMDMESQNMQEPYSWSFTTTASSTAPYVTAVTPAVDAVNVSLATTVRVTFNEAMDRASVERSFSISPSVNGVYSWNSASTRITFTPESVLAINTVYTVTVSTEAMDTQDEHLLAPYVWNFTTIPPSPPYVVSTTPTPGETGVNYTIWAVNFSEPMDDDTVEAAFLPSINVTGIFDFRWVNSSYVEFYLAPLSSSRVYSMTITTEGRDTQGENLTAPYSWSFTTGNVASTSISKWTFNVPSGQGTGEASPLIGDITSDLGEEVVYVGVDYVRCLNGRTGVTIWTYYDTAIGWNVQPQMGDIDNDGQYEIVIPLYSPTGILVLKTDNTETGTAARSLYWKRTGIGGSSYTSKPLIVDPDGDGYWMVFCAPEDVRGFSKYTLWDYDGDGDLDVFNNTYTARIWAFNYNGQEIKNGLWGTANETRTTTNGYNANLANARYQWFAWRPCSGGFAMADTDNDGLFELFQNDRQMYYGDGDFGKGTICWEWNATSQSLELKWYQPDMLVSSHTPILVDVDKDGVLDVVAAHMRGGLAIFNSTTGAEIKKDYSIGLPSHYQPVVYDIDRDGNLEILLADGDHPGNSPPDIVVFDLYKWVTGVPAADCVDARMYVGPCKFPPTVGEVTGDGIMDIIAVSDKGVFIFDGSHDPSLDHTYPVAVVATGRPYQCLYAVVQDIDADGLNEIVVTSSGYRVYAYDTPANATTPRPRSEVQYYNERRTGVAEYVPPVFYDRTTPIVSNPAPSREATNVSISLSRLNFTLTDIQGDLMSYIVAADFPVDSSDLIGTNRGDGTYRVDVLGPLEYHRKYTWSVSVTDGAHWNNKTYTFTTPDGTPPGSAPTHDYPLLVSGGTGDYENATSRDLICSSQNTYDSDGDDVTSIYRWLRNGQTVANLIMPFDTDSLTTAKDYSGYNNNGQVHGATWTDNGKVGGAYSFDGLDDYMVIPDGGAGYYNGRIYPSNLGGQGNWYEMTVEMWINLAELSTKESTRIMMKVPSYEIGLGSIGGSSRANNRLAAGVWLDNPDSGDNAGPPNSAPKADEYWSVSAPTSMPLSTNTWYHVAFTYKDGGGTSNSVLTLYINGVAVTTSTSRTTRGSIKASSGESLFIGWYDYFKGMIDEVRIYSRCLSTEQISQRYNETKDGLSSSSTLSNKETRTGENWTCQVIPNDSHQDGTARTSNPLLVLPGPQVAPVVSSVQVWGQTSLSTSRVWSNETIIAVYSYFDENNDPEVFGGSFGTQIRWYMNGTYMPAYDNLTSLSTSITTAHEDWTFQVKPGDGHTVAAEWTNASNKVTVNSPPVVTSYSPEYGYSLSQITLNIGDSQTFSFAYSEMDGDPVTILWQVDGVNMTEGVTSYTHIFNSLGSYTVRVRIYDTGYGSTYTTQSWNVVVR